MILFLRADLKGDTILTPGEPRGHGLDLGPRRVYCEGYHAGTRDCAPRVLERADDGQPHPGGSRRRILTVVVISPGSDPEKQGIRISMTMDDDQPSRIVHAKVDQIVAAVRSGKIEVR